MKISVLFLILLLTLLFAAACGGKSDVTGEVMPFERVCFYEKGKPVAVEGFIAPETMRCERSANKKSSSSWGCTFMVYSNRSKTGAGIPVFILNTGWLSRNNNRIANLETFSNLTIGNRNGNPLPKEDLQIYDNDGNLISANSKIRIFSKLPNSNKCEFGMAERIEKIEGETRWQSTENNLRNFPMESF